MSRALAILLVAITPALAAAGGVVRVYWNPYWYPYPPAYPYGYPYYPPPPPYYPPPPPAYGTEAPTPPEESHATAPPHDGQRATYGLIQLRDVPDGARVDLDGRFWLTAENLGTRWLAVGDGPHTITVHTAAATIERRIAVRAGTPQTVRFRSIRTTPR
jgi:hypothetical protein